jgi:hypothetical protein
VAAQPTKATKVASLVIDQSEDEIVAQEDLAITVETISAILEEPDVLSGPRYKELKRVGWEFGKTLAELGSGAGKLLCDGGTTIRLVVPELLHM